MIHKVRLIFLAGAVALAVALLPSPAPSVAQNTCDPENYCFDDLKRDCGGGENCGCWQCHSDKEICCFPKGPKCCVDGPA